MPRCLICGAVDRACTGDTPAPQHIIALETLMANRNEWTADRRLYLDAHGNVVEAGDPARATLLVAAGGTLPLAQARALGLVDDGEKAAPPPPNKARSKPAANKAK